ncbi:hypothetical protein K502DRAFT_353690 [Neoconidiobolus thromboides FSU 785]|nr:hypothetical protein K502DRAFT_353690 [Neoconidiobolus thromboides FSU 785]
MLAIQAFKLTITTLCLQFFEVGITVLVAAHGKISLRVGIASYVFGDMHLVQSGISEKLGFMIQNFFSFLSDYIVASAQCCGFSLVLMVITPLVTVVVVFYQKSCSLSTSDQNAYGKARSMAGEVLSFV